MKRLLWILLLGAAFAQQTTFIAPIAKLQFFGANGLTPDSGGKLCTYQAGTTTPLVTYTDFAGGTPNADPVILDSAGRATVWLAAQPYKLVLQDATGTANTCDGAVIWTMDNVTGIGGLTGANYNVTGQWTFAGSGSGFNVVNLAGNAAANIDATLGGITSTALLESVVSNGNSGEFQFQLTDPAPFGWRFCRTSGGNACPMKIAGGAIDGLFDVGGTNVGRTTITNTGNAGIVMHGTSPVDSSAQMVAVTSNSNVGEVQFQIGNVNPFGWKFVGNAASNAPVFFGGQAPTSSLTVNNNGSTALFSAILASAPGTPSNGQMFYCTDCTNTQTDSHTAGATCAGSGHGALAIRENAGWNCF